MGMLPNNNNIFENNIKYSSITFLKYTKLPPMQHAAKFFENYEIDKINKKYSLYANKTQKKHKKKYKKNYISKKIKMENKFILLKKNANRPDKIRIYDTRSPFCFTLMNIKVLLHILGYAKIYFSTFVV